MNDTKLILEKWLDWLEEHDSDIAFFGAGLVAVGLFISYMAGII